MLSRAAGRESGTLPEPDSEVARSARNSAEAALIPSADRDQPHGQLVLSAPLARMPVELDVSVPIGNFRVRNLLALAPGQIIESGWGHGEDVPLASGAVQLAWSEFEVIESQLAVRITRLG
jgi:flagellar motor switch protein FliN/FliY